MQRFLRFAVLAILLVAALSGRVLAKPMNTKFAKAIEKSPNIVVAKLLLEPDTVKDIATLEVTEVLRGDMLPGRQTVTFVYANTPVEPNRSEVVVFLDENKSWRFVAEPLHDRKEVAGSVLEMRGFFDHNAHFVEPGLITLDLLKKYFQDQVLEYRFRGQVYFPQQGKTEWVASTVSIQGKYDAVKEISEVRGLPILRGFPEQPEVYVHSLYSQGGIDLEYTRKSSRGLELIGLPQGLDPKTGEILVHFAVKEPEFLSESALRDYLRDEIKRGYWSSYKLPCVKQGIAGERVLHLEIGKETETTRKTMQIVGWDQEPISILSMAYADPNNQSIRGMTTLGRDKFPNDVEQELSKKDGILRLAAKTSAGESLILAFEFEGGAKLAGPFVWTFQDELPYLLYTRKAKGTLLVMEGKALQTVGAFIPVFETSGFNRNE